MKRTIARLFFLAALNALCKNACADISTNSAVTYTNIAEMQASYDTNTAHVLGYYKPDGRGEGYFYYDPNANPAKTNYGRLFAHASGVGCWRRVALTNVINMEEWGMLEVNPSDSTTWGNDSTVRYADCISNATDGGCTLYWPNYITAVTGLTIQNRSSLHFKGMAKASDQSEWPSISSVVMYIGSPSGIMFNITNSDNIEVDGVSFECEEPENPGSTNFITYASTGICIDRSSAGGEYNTTDCKFEDFVINQRNANATGWVGIALAPTSWQNCENMTFRRGSINGPGKATGIPADNAGGGIGITMGGHGGGGNAFNEIFDNIGFYAVATNMSLVGGDAWITGGTSESPLVAFYVATPTAYIAHHRCENMGTFLYSPGSSQIILEGNQIANGDYNSASPAIVYQGSGHLICLGNNENGVFSSIFSSLPMQNAQLESHGNNWQLGLGTVGYTNFQTVNISGDLVGGQWLGTIFGQPIQYYTAGYAQQTNLFTVSGRDIYLGSSNNCLVMGAIGDGGEDFNLVSHINPEASLAFGDTNISSRYSFGGSPLPGFSPFRIYHWTGSYSQILFYNTNNTTGAELNGSDSYFDISLSSNMYVRLMNSKGLAYFTGSEANGQITVYSNLVVDGSVTINSNSTVTGTNTAGGLDVTGSASIGTASITNAAIGTLDAALGNFNELYATNLYTTTAVITNPVTAFKTPYTNGDYMAWFTADIYMEFDNTAATVECWVDGHLESRQYQYGATNPRMGTSQFSTMLFPNSVVVFTNAADPAGVNAIQRSYVKRIF